MSEKNSGCLSSDKNRLLVVLSLTMIYPVFAGCLYVLYVFWLLPVALTPSGAPPMMLNPGFWLEGYWLMAVLIWMILLAIFLPLMGSTNNSKSKTVSYKRGSGVSIRDDSELTNGHKKGTKKAGASESIALVVPAAVDLCKAVSETSLNNKEPDSSSTEKLVDSRDEIKVVDELQNSKDNLDVPPINDSQRNSTVSLSDRQKLTKSGEFLNDCLKESYKSEEDVAKEGDIILGNTNCQVHTMQADESDGSDCDPVDLTLLPPTLKDSDEESCQEPIIEKVDRESIRRPSQYAEIEKTEALVLQQKENDDACETTPLSPVTDKTDDGIIEENISKDVTAQQLQSAPVTEEKMPLIAEETTVIAEEKPDQNEESAMRKKGHGLPALNTVRASQVLYSAPSTMSPRESNMVFLYVNADKEEGEKVK